MAVGGLASALLAILWTGVIGPTWQTAERAQNSAKKQQLASAWYETRSELAHVKEAGLWPTVGAISSEAESSEADDDLPPSVAVDAFESDEAPSWLNVAVILAHDRAAGDAANPSANQSLEN